MSPKYRLLWTLSILYLSTLSLPTHAMAQTTQQVLRTLYSNHFQLSSKGIPKITVGLMENKRRVRFYCTQDCTAHVYRNKTSPQQVQLLANQPVTLSLQSHSKAHTRYWMTAFRVHQQHTSLWKRLAKTWKDRNISLVSRKIGTVFSLNGKLLDNRMLLAVLGFYSTYREAKREATRLFTRYQTPIRIHEQLTKLPGARYVMRQGQQQWSVNRIARIDPGAGRITINRMEQGRNTRRHRFRTKSYQGEIIFAPDRHGKIAVINRLPLPTYLRGLLPAEMPAYAPLEALKAQAVCARNEILAKIGSRHHADPYLFCAHTHCQVYAGANATHPRTNKAVSETRGQVLMLSKTRMADTPYSAVCGGHTEHNEHVWFTPQNMSLRGKPDTPNATKTMSLQGATLQRWLTTSPAAYCSNRRTRRRGRFRWQKSYSITQITNLLKRRYDVGNVLDMKVTKRGVSGRAYAMKIVGDKKQILIHGELTIRKLFGNLSSSMFILRKRSVGGRLWGWQFIGGGWGHGVGMCQHGAMGRARAGHTYRKILKHYYSKTSLIRVY